MRRRVLTVLCICHAPESAFAAHRSRQTFSFNGATVIDGLRPIFFVPRTLWRTWGTRPVPPVPLIFAVSLAFPTSLIRSSLAALLAPSNVVQHGPYVRS